jgi:hypothetical protein
MTLLKSSASVLQAFLAIRNCDLTSTGIVECTGVYLEMVGIHGLTIAIKSDRHMLPPAEKSLSDFNKYIHGRLGG